MDDYFFLTGTDNMDQVIFWRFSYKAFTESSTNIFFWETKQNINVLSPFFALKWIQNLFGVLVIKYCIKNNRENV